MTFKTLTCEELEFYEKKNEDYARGGDPNGNFRRVASVLSNYPGLDLSDPVVVAMVYLCKQLDAVLWMKAMGYEGEIENVDSRLKDVHVYAKIARTLCAR